MRLPAFPEFAKICQQKKGKTISGKSKEQKVKICQQNAKGTKAKGKKQKAKKVEGRSGGSREKISLQLVQVLLFCQYTLSQHLFILIFGSVPIPS